MQKRYITLLCGLLSLFMIVLAGCQTIGGIDLNKVLLNGLNIESYEGEQTISLELILDPEADRDPGNAELSLLKNIKLSLTNIKAQDPKHFSADGVFSYANGTIPFKLSMTENELALQAEGLEKPIVYDLKAVKYQPGAGANPLLNDPQKLAKELAPFLINNLPNPKTVQVEPANVKVGAETLSLNKVHAEVKGSEATGLIKTMITNLLSDEKSLQGFTQQVLKLVMGDEYSPVIAELANAQMKDTLKEFAAGLDQVTDDTFLNERNYMKTDFYIDQDLNVRKKAFELYVSAPEGDNSGLNAIKVSGTADLWNFNKPVTASVIDTKDGSITFAPAAETRFPHIIKNLDPNSVAYKLLVKELKTTHKELSLPIFENGTGFYGAYINAETGTTMVPARYVSDQLDTEIKWDGDKQEVTVTDILSDKTIVFTIGSQTAMVDGKPVSLETAAVMKDGSTYVPIRFIAEAFGAKVEWDNDTRTVSIVKD